MAKSKKRRKRRASDTPMTHKAWIWVAIGLCALALAAVGVMLSILLNDWFFTFYPAMSRALMRPLAALSSLCPLSVWELALPALALWAIISLIVAIRRLKLQWLMGLLCGLSVGVSLFVVLWGLNHFGPTIDQKLSLDKREYTVEELTEAAAFYLKEANAWSEQVPRDDTGAAAMPTFAEMAAEAAACYQTLGADSELFRGSCRPVKQVLFWKPMSYFGITGIFVCLTGESCVNPDTYPASLPFTMCHEMGHRMAFAAEDEANFCAYLACRVSEDAALRYSGAYCAFLYCYNALYKVSPGTAKRLWDYAADGVKTDAAAASAHYAQYEGPVQDAATKVNDSYLKAFQEESGVQSYGEVADLLIALYLSEKSS